jgi:hypothetical protein
MNKLPTIDLKGKKYCQVKDRIKAFNEIYKKGCIQTESHITNEIVMFKATVYPNIIDEPTRYFTASSYGDVKGLKSFEKLESVAVGRCLAYLGFGIDGSIASLEEMENFSEREENEKEVNTSQTSQPQPQSQSLPANLLNWYLTKTTSEHVSMLSTIIHKQKVFGKADENGVRPVFDLSEEEIDKLQKRVSELM